MTWCLCEGHAFACIATAVALFAVTLGVIIVSVAGRD